MPDPSLLELSGARPPTSDKYTSLATFKFIGGLQSQRSPFAATDTRYNFKYLGGKPDALIAGSNIELSNKLTLQRRPGLVPYGVTSIPSPLFFYEWQRVAPPFLSLVVDTVPSIYLYTPTHAGIIINKATGSGQTSFFNIADTLYFGDGVDLYKYVGPNLLLQSNTFSNAVWTVANATLVGGQTDPNGGATATQVTWTTTGSTAGISQPVLPNYTPVASNTFTFSVWIQASGAESVNLKIQDNTATTIVDSPFALTTSWARYQVTGTASGTATSLKVLLYNPTSTGAIDIYGAQLEIAGPATPAEITTILPQGVFLWGIQAPPTAPTLTFSAPIGVQWSPNTQYSIFTLTAASVAVGGSTTYTGTISGGGGNAFAGQYFHIAGFTNPGNNGSFICTASSSTTLVLTNSNGVAETNAGTAAQGITDSSGNLEYVDTPGVSGSTAPTWSTIVGGVTTDGVQNIIVQAPPPSNNINSTTGSVNFPANVTPGNTILAFVSVINNNTGPSTPTVNSTADGNLTLYKSEITNFGGIFVYYILSAAGGATTMSVSGGGSAWTWLAVVEIENMTAMDGTASNSGVNVTGSVFQTGSVTTTNATDFVVTFAEFDSNRDSSSEIGNPPTNYTQLASQQGINVPFHLSQSHPVFANLGAYAINLATTQAINPTWTITNVGGQTNSNGITAAFKCSVTSSLSWINGGPIGLTSNALTSTGYTYYYAFEDSVTGHLSNVSPLSASSGTITSQAITVTGSGMQITPSGPANQDPQVTTIAIFRNTDGGAFWYQVATVPNPGTTSSAGTWSYTDTTPDNQLNTLLFAPIGLLNSPPPAGLTNLAYFAGRMWGTVGQYLYYNTGPDNAAALNVTQNGVPAESWEPSNLEPYNNVIVRTLSTAIGLMVWTFSDLQMETGTNLSTFSPVNIFPGHGIRTYNAVAVDGSSFMIYTGDRQCLIINPSSGSIEVGFPIGDLLENNVSPINVYLARHVGGSQDNAFFLADGSTGWFRLNPNQTGASASGEQTPVWSPFATISGGCGAIQSIETSPGIHQLLVGQLGNGVVLVRNINTFSDNGTSYPWSATIGSIVLATPGKLAETAAIVTEFNNINNAATQCGVSVILDEIGGNFQPLPQYKNDPPQLVPSQTVLSNRFYLSQGEACPTCRHLQVQFNGAAAVTKDELLAFTVIGALVAEQNKNG